MANDPKLRDRVESSASSGRRDFLRWAGLASAAVATRAFAEPAPAGRASRPNVLFIAVDDLRPQLGCYGHAQMVSPNIDRLAASGMVFERAYCNVPVCGASRASLLSGMRPLRDRFVTYFSYLQEHAPGVAPLPGHLKRNGYVALSNGKVFHHQDDCAASWSEPPWRPDGHWRDYQSPESVRIAKAREDYAGPAFEGPDAADDAYFDGRIANRTIADLRRLAGGTQPFFLAAGFRKPHLPFNAPKRYWDLYERAEIDLADNPFRPKGAPDAALHNWGELRAYAGIPAEGPLDDELARTLIHGYYACTSYTDAQVGRLLDELERLGLTDDTIVILWGDHGWNLGEHGLWCKHCNFETSLWSPLLVRAPGFRAGLRSRALTEFVDVYPSLCELCGVAAPSHLEGTSFVPLMREPAQPWKRAVFSRYHDGHSVKTDGHRYTEWRSADGETYARMLFDHENDPMENVNLSEQPAHQQTVRELSGLLQRGWRAALPPTR